MVSPPILGTCLTQRGNEVEHHPCDEAGDEDDEPTGGGKFGGGHEGRGSLRLLTVVYSSLERGGAVGSSELGLAEIVNADTEVVGLIENGVSGGLWDKTEVSGNDQIAGSLHERPVRLA